MGQTPIVPTNANSLTSGSPTKAILKLAAPTVAAMLTQSIVNEIDIIFFAHLPCPDASNGQAALLPSLIVLWVFGGSLSAISVGTQALSARRYAERKDEQAGSVLFNALGFSVIAGICFTLLAYLVMPSIIRVMIRVPEVQNVALEYLNWRILGVTSMAATFAFKAFFDGIGRPQNHLLSAVVMNALNIILCYAFIFGNWGAPRMGAPGAGFAAFIATYVGLAIMVVYAFLPRYRSFRPFAFAHASKETLVRILRLSVPSAIATIAVMSGFGLFAAIVAKLDQLAPSGLTQGACGATEAVNGAATTGIVGVLKLTFTACLAFGTATATLVSQSLGERDPDKAARFGWTSVRLGLVIFGVVGLLEGVIFTEPLLRIISHSPAVQQAALLPMRVMGICTPLIAVGMILTQALFGAGNSRFVMVVELILHFTCLVPLSWVLGISLGFGLPGIWAAAVCYVIALSTIMVWKFASGDWKKIHI